MDPIDLFNNFFTALSLDGSILTLNEQEKHLASMVFPVVVEEVSQMREPDVQTEPDSSKVEGTKKNLKKILELFNKVQKGRDEFISCFPEWSKIRTRNIEELRDTANSMHEDRFKCNVSRLVGSSAGVAGGAALITCLLMPPTGDGIVPLSIVGGGISLVGGGVVFVTSATEYSLLEAKNNKAQQILKDDHEAFHAMANWFEHPIALVEAFEAVMGFQVMKALAKDLKEFTNDISNWNSFRKALKKSLKNSLGVIFDTENNFVASLGMHLTSIILTFCVVVVMAHQRNCVLLDCVILTHRLVFSLLSGLDLGIEVGRGIMMAISGGKFAADISSKLARAVFHGVFGGIGLTLDIINITLTSIDVHMGSCSKQGIQIFKTADKMNEELEILKKVYEGLKRDAECTSLPL